VDKITYRARQIPTGLPGSLMLEAQELETELAEFLREQHRYAKKKELIEPAYVLEFEVSLRRWYRRRSLNANNLAWELATRLAQVDGVSKEVVYYAVKELTELPRDEYKGIFVSRPSGNLTTVEFAKFIERLVIECEMHEPHVEIRDIWILFTEWRFGQDYDPLQGTYSGKDDYREKHPACEACGKCMLYNDGDGIQRLAGEVAHIVSAGSGGEDVDWNWLMLCAECHRGIQHQLGWEPFIECFTHLKSKVERARSRAGKKPVDRDPDPPIQAAPREDEGKAKMAASLNNLEKLVNKHTEQAELPLEDGGFETPPDF